ncbi:MAG: oligosaccharide flippase family protein [Thermoplasmata archaeon]|nr:oligosaccharide flippase family protein [Thermoplasmata archaeon]
MDSPSSASGVPASVAPRPKPVVPKAALSLTLSSGAVFFASLAIQLLGVGASYFLYHHIGDVSETGAALLGTVQLFLLIGSSINGIGDLRLGTAYTYYLARGKPATDNTTVYLLVRMGMVASVGLVLFVIAPMTIGGHSIVTGNIQWTSLGIFLALPILWSFSTVYNAMFIGEGNSLKAQYPGLVEALARLPVLIYVAYHDPTIQGLTIAYVVGAAASTLFSLPAILRRTRKFRQIEVSRLFRFAWPLMGSLMLNYLVTNMIPFIVDGAAGPVGLNAFLLANGFRILVLSLPAAVSTPLFPYIAGLHQQEQYEGVRRGTWQALRYTSILLVPGVVALVTYRSTFLLVLGGTHYVAVASIPLAILVVGAIPLSLSQVMQSAINAIGRQRLELYITSTQVAVLLGACYLFLVPNVILPHGLLPHGEILESAAIAVLLSSAAALALNTYFLETLLAVRIQLRSVVGITVGALFAFGVISRFNKPALFSPALTWQLFGPVALLNRFGSLQATTGFELVWVLILCFVVYFLTLVAIGELTKQDVHLIGNSIGLPAELVNFFASICWRASSPGLSPEGLARAKGLRQPELPETFTGTGELPEIAGTVPPNGDEEERRH